jgi:hypothetical protein
MRLPPVLSPSGLAWRQPQPPQRERGGLWQATREMKIEELQLWEQWGHVRSDSVSHVSTHSVTERTHTLPLVSTL